MEQREGDEHPPSEEEERNKNKNKGERQKRREQEQEQERKEGRGRGKFGCDGGRGKENQSFIIRLRRTHMEIRTKKS